jgi:uncharacterized membrane protein YhaH (DUF805 family)
VKLRVSDLWRWDGTLDRGPYAVLGLLLTALKYNLDRLLLSSHSGRWVWYLYWAPGNTYTQLLKDPEASGIRWALFLTSLPFLWAGVVLTLRRLRSAGLPPWPIVLFCVPVLNLLFFALLCVLPPRDSSPPAPDRPLLGRLIPHSYWGSAALAMVLTVVPMGLTTILATQVAQKYGWTIFIAVPFMIGFYSSIICCYHRPRPFGACFAVAAGSLSLLALLLLVAAFEGIICILMAAPLALFVALGGTMLGYLVQSIRRDPHTSLFGLLLLLPLLIGGEAATAPEAPLQRVSTSVEIDASPEQIWRHVVAFTEIPAPRELIFRTGIAYQLRAEITGAGAGAVRHCVFTTGPFVEPITTWDEPRLLGFGVTAQPAPMEEWTPWPPIHPPHLEGCFVSRRGQFLLEPLPGGRTRLEGTTWYTHELFPTCYWGLWSDAIIHRIHLRVLAHVKVLAEGRP